MGMLILVWIALGMAVWAVAVRAVRVRARGPWCVARAGGRALGSSRWDDVAIEVSSEVLACAYAYGARAS